MALAIIQYTPEDVEFLIGIGDGPGLWKIATKFFDNEADPPVTIFTGKPNNKVKVYIDTLFRMDPCRNWRMAGWVLDYDNPHIPSERWGNRRCVIYYDMTRRDGVLTVLKKLEP
jgi:hypothetical protein